jgi:hypothetical protein
MHPEVCSTSAAFHERCRAVPARLTGAKEEPVEAACPHQVNGGRCQESTTWASSAPARTSRTGEYEQLRVHPLRARLGS